MNATMKQLFLALALFCYTQVRAQTTDLIYHLGSSGSSLNIASVATDATGNIFICGDFNGSSVEFDPLGTSTTKNSAASGSGFIASYTINGVLKKVIVFGSGLVNKGLKVYVDPTTQNVYLLAVVSGSVRFSGIGFGSAAGNGSMALVKYDNALSFKSSKIFNNGLGLNTGDLLTDISISGPNLYLTGSLFSSNVEFNPGGTSKQLSSAGVSDIIVAKYDTATLTNIWAYALGGPNADGGAGIGLDNSGNIYLTGYFTGQNISIDPAALKSVSEAGGGSSTGDALVAKYNASMACQWAFNIGAAQADQGKDILVDKASGNIYVGGFVKKDALKVYFDPTTTSAASFSGVGLNDIFLASYTSAGNYNWNLATGSTGEDALASLAFDQTGNIVLAGFTSGNVDFGSSHTITGKGGMDAFFAVVSSTSGASTSAYNLGSAINEQANATAVDINGKILVAGNYTASGTYNIANATVTPISGTQDGFVTRNVLCTPPSITTQPIAKTVCEGLATSLSVTATSATTYQWKNGSTNIVGATSSTYSISTVTLSQAGSYSVVVGNACQSLSSSTITLTVNPKPVINSASTTVSCSGVAIAYTATSVTPSSYAWTRAIKGGILPSTAGSGNVASISEVLNNSTNVPIDVVYSIIPTSTVGTCVGYPFPLTLTVNPKPSISSSATGTVCSGTAQSYAITSVVGSTYNWSRVLVAGITNSAVSNQTANPITETLVNNTANPVNVVYSIVPTSTAGTCQGAAFTYTVTVNPGVSGSVAIAANKTSLCSGELLTLTATAVNGGTTPTYQWKRGGVDISGETNAIYNTIGSLSGDVYTVAMTSNLNCASATPAISNAITVTVTPSSYPTLSATASSTTICPGTNLTLTATATDAGAATYQWKSNDVVIVGATNNTYNTNAVSNGDYFSVVMTSPLMCANPKTIQSSDITILLSPTPTPTINVTASNTSICANATITFTTSSTNGGASPTYQWKNGTVDIAGATSSTYNTTTAANGDSYSVVMTSNLACASPKIVQSAAIPITVTPVSIATVSVAASATTICANTSITLTASSTNGGSNPNYKWKLGTNYIAGAINPTYTTSSASNGDSYTVEMTSNLNCASPSTVVSSPTSITVNPLTTTTVSITASNSTICPGANIDFTAVAGNGGTPTYQWKKGATDIAGATNNIYSTTTAANGDNYSVVLTSSLACPNPKTIQSTAIPISVTASFAPSVAVTASSTTTICANTPITFTANPTNGGTPTYKWKLGTNYISGATNSTYTATNPSNNDNYSVEMTNPSACANPNTVTSSPIVLTVNPILVPTATISATSTTICLNDLLTFNLSTTNAGTTPTYVWYKNGSAIIPSATGNSYSTTSAANGDKFKVTLTSNAQCANTSPVFSNELTVTVNPLPTISGVTAVCEGSTISLSGTGTANSTTPWVSSNPANATISNLGIVSGILAGTSIITYTNTNGCKATTSITVNVKPTITGTLTVCVGSTTQLTGNNTPASSNAWISASSSVASISTTGLVSGKTSGVSVITYQTIFGCTNTVTVTVTDLPTITGTPTVCVGSTTQLSGSNTADATTPWVSGTPSVATINNTGVVTGVFAGTSLITYKNSNGCSITQLVTVNPNLVPTVSITADNSTICIGTNIIFTANPVNGGGAPTYQWKLNNGAIAGATNSTYSTTTAKDGESYSLAMSSNDLCTSTAAVNSHPIVITVATSVIPKVTVIANPNNTNCAGTLVTFTATPSNGGTAPTYQWKKGGTAILNATNSTYSSSTLATGDDITVDMVSNSSCASTSNASSTPITMTVNPNVTASVALTASTNSICEGTNVVFTAASTNPGSTPMYQWFVNNISQGTASASNTFNSSSLLNNDQVKVALTSNASCVNVATVTSNSITMLVTTKVTPTVSITSDKTTICSGGSVNFTATATNAGSAAFYQWKINNVSSGAPTSSNVFISSSLTNGNTVTVELTSSISCVTQSTATSTGIAIVIAAATQIVTQPADQSVCALGNNVTFTVAAVGDALTYQWKIGSTDLANNSTYTGVTTKDLTVSHVANSDLVGYSVYVSGSCGNATSTVANLSVSASAITILTQPSAKSVAEGDKIQLSIAATGPTLAYQWMNNGVNLVDDSRISGSNTASVQISNAVLTDAGTNYTCLITSPCTTPLTSNAVVVTVTATATSIQDSQSKGFRIAPNPSNGRFNISNSFTPFTVNEIEIVSMQGVVVASKTVNASTSLDEDLSLQDLPKGMYMVLIKGDSDQALLKVVIDK
jgi:hypothetical protein